MAETTRVNIIDIETKDSENSLQRLKKEIKDLKSKLLDLDEGTEEFNKTLKELGDRQFALKDINEKAMRSFSDSGEILANTASLCGSVTSAIGGVTAGLQLMGVESEEAEKGIQKLMQLMVLSQSFASIEDGIDKFKNLKLAIKSATAGISKLKLALGSIGVGVAITAIGLLVSHLQKLKEESEKAKEAFEETFETDVFKFQLLSEQFKELEGNEQAQLKLLVQNKDLCEKLGVATTDLATANQVLIDQKEDYIQMLKDKIEYEEIYQKILSKIKEQNQLDEYDKAIVYDPKLSSEDKQRIIDAHQEIKNILEKDIKSLKDDLAVLAEKSAKLEEQRELKREEEKNKEKIKLAIQAEKEKLAKLAELRQQALVWEQTEEDVVEETPKIETGNENFKYDNQTDEEFYDSVLTKANEVAQTEIEINAKKNDIIVDQEIATSNRIKAEKEKRIAIFKTTIDAMNMIMSASSQLLSAMQGSIDTETKKGFEENKKYEVAQATIAYLQGLVSAVSSAMQLGPIAGPIASVVLSGILSATYGVNVAKIKSTKFGETTTANSNVPSVNTSAVNSLQQPSFSNVRPTFSQSDVEELPMQKTYVLASDIETAINTRRTTVRNSTF